MIYLRQSTASQEISLGQFVDSNDGDTEEPSLTIANTDIKLFKTGATTLANKNSGGATYISNGIYYAVLDATDTNILGSMVIFVHVAGALTIKKECLVLPANIYDSWILGTDNQVVALTASATSAQLVDDIWDEGLTGGSHNVPTSSGRRLRAIQDFQGYETGGIWVDTINGAAGTIDFENGTVENPVLTWADALTINTSLNFNKFIIKGMSTITLSANSDNYFITGENWTLVLNGQSIVGLNVIGASVSGIGSGVGTLQKYEKCEMNAISHIKGTHIDNCGIGGTQTAVEAGDFYFDNCHSDIAGTATWIFDFGGAIGNTNLNIRHYSGGIEIKNMGATGTDTMSLEGHGLLVLNSNCDPSNSPVIAIRGHFTITDNVAGGFIAGGGTISDDARYDITQINDQVVDALTVDTIAELAQGNPETTPTMAAALMRLYMALIHNIDISATEKTFDNNAGTVIWKKPLSDDGTTYTEGEGVTGP